jgi:hypothetical protein
MSLNKILEQNRRKLLWDLLGHEMSRTIDEGYRGKLTP